MTLVPRAGVRTLAVLALGAALGLAWLARASRPPAAPEVARSTSATVAPQRVPVLEPLAAPAPRAEIERLEIERAEVSPAPPAASESIESRCERVVSELAAWLTAPEFDRVEWQQRLRAHAGSLGDDALETLLATAADVSDPVERRVCAAELLRTLQASSGSAVQNMSASALACLRAACADPSSSGPLAEAAASSLAALGTDFDVQQFLTGFLHGEAPERARAAVALPHVFEARSWVALELARALATNVQEPDRVETGLSVLLGLARERGAALDGSAVAAEFDALARNPDLEPRLRRRALSALALIAPRSPALEAWLTAEDPELAGSAAFELAADATGEGARTLAVALAVAGLEPGDERRELLARALAYSPGETPLEERVFAHSQLIAGTQDPDPLARRSTVFALAALAEPSGASLVAGLARSDPDSTVRASAVRALRSFERSAAIETWTACARSDSDATVRALAEQELRRSGHALEDDR